MTRPGCVTVQSGDADYQLCLTLGALHQIEAVLGEGDLTQLGERLSAASSADMTHILQALLEGGGHGDAHTIARTFTPMEAARAIAASFKAAFQ